MNKPILWTMAIVLLITGLYFLNNNQEKIKKSSGLLEIIGEGNFNFGEILITGGRKTTEYVLKNNSENPLKIVNVETNCACTEGILFDENGKEYGPFGMQGGLHKPNPKIALEVLPGEEVKVKAVYDPMAHGPNATGEIVREIYIQTSGRQNVVLSFRGMVVKELSERRDKLPADKAKVPIIKNISSNKLAEMLKNKDFTLIDVHVPEQEHIPGTDALIAYNDIEGIIKKVPNKNDKIVLYCRSGGMSIATANALKEKGYTNIYNLEKGLSEWKNGEREVMPIGSINISE